MLISTMDILRYYKVELHLESETSHEKCCARLKKSKTIKKQLKIMKRTY